MILFFLPPCYFFCFWWGLMWSCQKCHQPLYLCWDESFCGGLSRYTDIYICILDFSFWSGNPIIMVLSVSFPSLFDFFVFLNFITIDVRYTMYTDIFLLYVLMPMSIRMKMVDQYVVCALLLSRTNDWELSRWNMEWNSYFGSLWARFVLMLHTAL